MRASVLSHSLCRECAPFWRTSYFGGTTPFGDHSTIGRVSRGHTGGDKYSFFPSFRISLLPHLPPAVLALIFIARRILGRPFSSSTGTSVCLEVRGQTNTPIAGMRFFSRPGCRSYHEISGFQAPGRPREACMFCPSQVAIGGCTSMFCNLRTRPRFPPGKTSRGCMTLYDKRLVVV